MVGGLQPFSVLASTKPIEGGGSSVFAFISTRMDVSASASSMWASGDRVGGADEV